MNQVWALRRRLVYTRDILSELVLRDIKLRYKRSIVGMGWTLLNPLAESLVLFFVFKLILPLNIPSYSAYLFSGILVFGWFQSSLFHAANAIVGNRDLVRQPGFPSAILPVVTVASNLIHFLLALPVLFILMAVHHTWPTAALLGLPAILAVQFLLTVSFAYLVAASHVRFRDTQYVLGLSLQLLFYLSPVFYSPDQVPERFQWLYRLNPMVFFLTSCRGVFLEGRQPDYLVLLELSVLFAALLWVSWAVFVRASHHFVEELG